MVPGSLAIISASFDEAERGRAIGTWSGATSMTTALGPVLGGWLIQHASWRWAFFINLPLAVAVIAISLTHVPESRSTAAKGVDWLGAIIVTVGLGGLVFGLIESAPLGWSNPLVLGPTIISTTCLLFFFFVEARVETPMVPLQLFQFKLALRMTRRELRDEAKESDGRPETKQRIRQMQQTLARRRMMHKVPTADVVIVNPTHFAVALKYDPKEMRAPRVLAKGVDLVAQNIRRIAEEHRVPVFESPKLARALYRSTDLNKEIPAGLYAAVAQVLSYIFRVRSLNPTIAARVARPNPQVGGEFDDA